MLLEMAKLELPANDEGCCSNRAGVDEPHQHSGSGVDVVDDDGDDGPSEGDDDDDDDGGSSCFGRDWSRQERSRKGLVSRAVLCVVGKGCAVLAMLSVTGRINGSKTNKRRG